ncbi:MAG TPA: EAL domain-containing protein [Polyangiaceae bacterium]|nr:EAL domain-containing protein [Polyangiaceae bacterium]
MPRDVTLRVLLVDDDPGVLRDYGLALRRIAEVVEASDGVQALALIASQSFDVIVSDISMPRLNGVELLCEVRKHDLDVPVVLITGQPEVGSAMKAVEYGALLYLPKPVKLETLWETVRRAGHLRKLARLRREALEIEGTKGKSLGDRAALDARFQLALDQLFMVYQPVVSWGDQRVLGYEALVRSSEPSLATPRNLFDAAERLDRVHELGRRIRSLVENTAHENPAIRFFVNLHPLELNDFALYSATAPLAAVAERVVFEMTERVTLEAVKEASARIARLRTMGFRIALDDLGAGYAGLSSFAVLEPDFVKLDRSLVEGVDRSVRKQSIIRSMLRLCQVELGMYVICEGVETAQERDALVDVGAELFQGFLFGQPARELNSVRW